MTMRRIPYSVHIEDLQVEMRARKDSLEKLVEKLESVGLTEDERELANAHVKWIDSHKQEIKDFYRPAMYIGPKPTYG